MKELCHIERSLYVPFVDVADASQPKQTGLDLAKAHPTNPFSLGRDRVAAPPRVGFTQYARRIVWKACW
jgi:ABC-type uncharacterized transport system auxiliary subunit